MPLHNARIAITGASGFIGSHLTRACVAEGASVGCFIRNQATAWRLTDILPQVTVFPADLEDASAIHDAIHTFKPDIILHLAANTKRTRDLALYERQHSAHVQTTLNLIRAARELPGLVRFVHTGTIEEYGRGDVPFQETQREEPVTPYSLTKHEATRLTLYAAHEHAFPATVLRLPPVYGPLQGKGMFIPDFIRAALTTGAFDMSPGEQTRDFLHVDDAVQAFLRAAEDRTSVGEIFNVGTGVETKLKDAADLLRTIWGTDIQINRGAFPCDPHVETMRCVMSIEKIRTQLGWSPRSALEDGLRRTVEWYKSSAHLYEHLWD